MVGMPKEPSGGETVSVVLTRRVVLTCEAPAQHPGIDLGDGGPAGWNICCTMNRNQGMSTCVDIVTNAGDPASVHSSHAMITYKLVMNLAWSARWAETKTDQH